jgi:hypothetical protein
MAMLLLTTNSASSQSYAQDGYDDYADYQDYAGEYGQDDKLYYDYAQRQESKM